MTEDGYYLYKENSYNLCIPADINRSGYMKIMPFLSYKIEVEELNSNLNTSGYFNIANGKAGQYVFDSSKVDSLTIYDVNFNKIKPNYNSDFAVYYLNHGKYYLDVASSVSLNIHKMDEATASNYLDFDSEFNFTGSIAKFKAKRELFTIPEGYILYDENFNFVNPYV